MTRSLPTPHIPTPPAASSTDRRQQPTLWRNLSVCHVGDAALTRDGDCVLIVEKPPDGDLLSVYEWGAGLHRRAGQEPVFRIPPIAEGPETGWAQRDRYVAGFMHRVCCRPPLSRGMFDHDACADDWFAGYTAAETHGPSPVAEHVWNARTHDLALASYADWRLQQIIRPLR